MLYPQYQRLMKLCMLCSVMIILPCGTTSYSAVFGTTRYGRSSIPSHRTATSTQWIPASYGLPLANYKAPRVSSQIPANYPGFYYEPFYNPYPQDYFDEYFYPQQDPLAYPLYYAPTRNSKYEPYQTFPYFYDDRRMRQPIPYELYNSDEDSYPMADIQDRMLQDDPKDFDNDVLDQDDWYENDLREQQPDINNDNANSAFLHNLILSQMYNDALKKQNKWKTNGLDQVTTDAEENNDYYDKSEDDTWPDNEYQSTKNQNFDEKNEDALKTLENYQSKYSNDIKRLRKYGDEKPDKKQKSTLSMDPNDTNMWINWYNKRNLNTEKINKKQETPNHGLWSPIHKKLTFSDRKNIHSIQTVMPKEVSTTLNPITSTTITSTSVPITSSHLKLNAPNNKKTGQKEFVLLRPATPVRHPFTEPILELLAQQKNQNDVKRSPSVYNTIKQLLNMEDNFKEDEAVFNHNSNHKNLKKRYVTSENTLVNELKELKKTSY
ncbi:uncharacterized protein LOC123295373 [Chrysoperla carnea]|uniref:uncharacterized protein LOC123295373 n=1 Tax=Chrysoperla carnea TaxID=189513 RepID=UPI001D0679B4|nr:uncharacterized protein LOC123295373 [Chrysoperla carnea]